MPYNIVLLTMSMNIGGAETHIVELAKALKAKGHNITVFSKGGVYASQLEAEGITHITAPMHTKKLGALIQSIGKLSAYCRHNDVSVIHSHTRITNFIAHWVCKKYNIPMVTTVHFNFKLNFFTKLFSRWGDRALSVSEDLKDYVVNSYGYDRDKVRVTVNGIDLTTFTKGTNPDLRSKYNLTEEHKVILCVSRIDAGASENVFRFLESAKEIYDSVPLSRIIIVGSGNQFKQLQNVAAEINAQTTENYIQLAGAQTNISEYCRMADAFAGVSRSALEAMASKLPTLLIGNAGYLGVYSKEVHQACIDTNFTYRGYDYVSPSEVARIMIDMLQTPEKFEENIAQAYRLVEKRYSVIAMAEDALTSYREAMKDIRPHELMVCGYYGNNNFGDDTTLRALVKNTQNAIGAFRPIVLTHHGKPYRKDNYFCIHRFNLPKIIHYMKKTKCLVLGGGSLLQDATSNRSFLYYTTILRLALHFGCRTMLYGNGIGPVGKKRHMAVLKKLLNRVDVITLRDAKSVEFIKSLGISSDSISLTADETFTVDATEIAASDTTVVQTLQKIPQKKLLINLRHRKNVKQKQNLHALAASINRICQQNDLTAVLLPIYYKQDIGALKRLKKLLQVPSVLIDQPMDAPETVAVLSQCDYVLAERLHLIIFSALLQKPFAAISYDPKVSAMADELQVNDYCIATAHISQDTVYRTLQNLISRQDILRQTLKENTECLREKAVQNHKALCALLEKEI